jgi:Fe-S cluster assembly scaffold protein SufB
MTLLFHNPKKTDYTIHESWQQIDLFQQTERTLTLHLQKKAEATYAMFLENAKIELTIIAEEDAIKGQIFAFFPAKNASHSTLNVQTFLQSSHSKVNVHLIAIQDEKAEVDLQGAIHIGQGVEKVSGHLLEEVILLGNAKYTSLQPILNVASPDVQASHGARVHKIPLEKLFYMQSRGLTTSVALAMIIGAYVQQILEHFELSEKEKETIKTFVS